MRFLRERNEEEKHGEDEEERDGPRRTRRTRRTSDGESDRVWSRWNSQSWVERLEQDQAGEDTDGEVLNCAGSVEN